MERQRFLWPAQTRAETTTRLGLAAGAQRLLGVLEAAAPEVVFQRAELARRCGCAPATVTAHAKPLKQMGVLTVSVRGRLGAEYAVDWERVAALEGVTQPRLVARMALSLAAIATWIAAWCERIARDGAVHRADRAESRAPSQRRTNTSRDTSRSKVANRAVSPPIAPLNESIALPHETIAPDRVEGDRLPESVSGRNGNTKIRSKSGSSKSWLTETLKKDALENTETLARVYQQAVAGGVIAGADCDLIDLVGLVAYCRDNGRSVGGLLKGVLAAGQDMFGLDWRAKAAAYHDEARPVAQAVRDVLSGVSSEERAALATRSSDLSGELGATQERARQLAALRTAGLV
jgi:hypothetical protein